jgi:hypothetical protein
MSGPLLQYEKDVERGQQMVMEAIYDVWSRSQIKGEGLVLGVLLRTAFLLLLFWSGLFIVGRGVNQWNTEYKKEWACTECPATPAAKVDMCRACGGEVKELVGRWQYPYLGFPWFERKGSKVDVNR